MVSFHAATPEVECSQVEKPQDLRTDLVGIKLGQMSGAPDFYRQVPAFRRRVARSFEFWLGPNASQADLSDATELLLEMAEMGAADIATAVGDVNSIHEGQPSTNARLLRTLALVPGWQSGALALSEVPVWALPLCAAVHFSGPRLLTIEGQGDAFARDYLRALADLIRLGTANRASSAVRAAFDCFRRSPHFSPAWAGPLWSEVSAARFKLFSAMHAPVAPADLFPMPREGRRLRVGIIARQLADHGAGASLMPLVEQLDTSRFELCLFSSEGSSPIATQLRNRGAVYSPLADAASAIAILQGATVDVAIFVSEPASFDEFVYQIVRERVAPLQVWFDGLQESPGIPQVDLFLAGSLGAAPEFRGSAPRLALLPGIGSTSKNDLKSSGGEQLTRESVGLADETLVMVSFTPLSALSLGTLSEWARLLCRRPNSKLILCGSEMAGDDWLQRFSTQFDQIAVSHGANPEQVVISSGRLASHEARKQILALADLVLESHDYSVPEAAFAAAECRVPVVVRAGVARLGQRSADLLNSAGLTDLVADSSEQLEAIVARLAADAPWRAAQTERLGVVAPRWLAMHDSFALSEAFGWTLETAYDEIAADRRAFARKTYPLLGANPAGVEAALSEARDLLDVGLVSEAAVKARYILAADGAHPEARGILAHALRLEGKHNQAAHLLVSQLDLSPLSAEKLCEVAKASLDAGEMANAMKALITALSVDEKHVESWLLLARFDDAELRQEITAILPKIAPDDPQVQQLLAQWGLVGSSTS